MKTYVVKMTRRVILMQEGTIEVEAPNRLMAKRAAIALQYEGDQGDWQPYDVEKCWVVKAEATPKEGAKNEDQNRN